MDCPESNRDGYDRCSKQFLDPAFTPPEDLGDTYELPDDGYLYFVGVPKDTPPVWRRYMLVDGVWVDITPDVQE